MSIEFLGCSINNLQSIRDHSLQAESQYTMDDLRDLGMLGQVMFCTDHPYGGQNALSANLDRLLSFKLSQAELEAIGRGKAAKLFPKFA